MIGRNIGRKTERRIREESRCSSEPILGWQHCWMLMDDTIILATSREKMLEKLKLLDLYCMENGMRVNASKTKLMVINGKPVDKIPFVLSNFVVKACSEYVYLGTVFTADGRTDSSIQAHLECKNKDCLLYTSPSPRDS